MPNKIQKVILVAIVAWQVIACVDLKHVSGFSETSIASLQSYENLPKTYALICRQDCERKHIANYKIYKASCNCENDQKADSITQIIYRTTVNYLNGLQLISDPNLSKLQTSALSQSLSAGTFGSITIGPEEVEAYSKLSTLLLRSYSSINQRTKLKTYILDGNDSFKKILEYLKLSVSGNLYGKIEVQKQHLVNFYFDFLRDKNLSDFEKVKFSEDYFNQRNLLESEQETLLAFGKIIDEILEGHAYLVDHVENLEDKEARTKLALLSKRMAWAAQHLKQLN